MRNRDKGCVVVEEREVVEMYVLEEEVVHA